METHVSEEIPYPQFHSWMHTRCVLPRESVKKKIARWNQQPFPIPAIEAVVSRFARMLNIFSPRRRHITYKFVVSGFRWYFRIFNRLKAFGKENIPPRGCIFYANHPGSFDPLILYAAIPHIQVAGFVSWGNGWFADMLEACYGISPFRQASMPMKVEKMIREILLRNRFFAIWPEGHPHPGPIEQGFSSIIRVYATLNYNKDRIPFLPVHIRGKGAERKDVQHKMGPIEIYFFKPLFLNRQWLKRPAEGGKTPREIIDFLMLHLARKNGQESLAPNPRLEQRRVRWAKMNPLRP